MAEFRGNAGAGVGHEDAQVLPLEHDADADLSVSGGVANGVGQEVLHDARDDLAIRERHGWRFRALENQTAVSHQRFEIIQALPDHLREVALAQIQLHHLRLHLADIQDAVDHADHAARGAHRIHDILLGLGPQLAPCLLPE